MGGTAAAAGAISGTAVAVALQPFDVVRTRLQACAAAGRPRTAVNAVREIAAEGGAARLWRGTSAAALRVGGGAAIQFGSLRFLRTRSPPDAVNDAFIGAAARGASVVVMCPITTVKTRMEASHVGARQYRSVGDALATIVRTQGAGALVRGLPPLLLTNVPFAAIHYASYRRLQALGRDYADGWTLNLVAGSLASTAATVATQPFDALRARAMLDLPMPRSLQGLFAGFVPRLAKRPLQTTLIWALFEDLDKRLRTRSFNVDMLLLLSHNTVTLTRRASRACAPCG